MNIVKQEWGFLNTTLSTIPAQTKKLYLFGFMVLTLRKIDSLRSNCRILDLNWFTAKSKAYRLTINGKLNDTFKKLVVNLDIVRKNDIICVDFSDFDGFQVLLFTKQTQNGRAIPVYFEILIYPIEKDSQNTSVIQAIKNFTDIIGFKPKLIMDRGFAYPAITRYLAKNRHLFVIRIKQIKSDFKTGQKLSVKDSKDDDFKALVYEKKLRIVVSDKMPEDENQPWYLVTNDFQSTREKIVENYYYRFEIEEFIKDAKRLLGLEYLHFKKLNSLSIILWFVILGIWFL